MDRRKRVDVLRANEKVSPIARPVDTFVQQAATPQVQPNRAFQIINALAPAASDIAQREFRKEQQEQAEAERQAEIEANRRQREIDARIKQRNTYEAKIQLAKANAGWEEWKRERGDSLLDMSDDELAEARLGIYTDALSSVTDPDAREAADFEQTLRGVEELERLQAAREERKVVNLGNDLLSTFITSELSGEEFNASLNNEFKRYSSLYNVDPGAVNDRIAEIALQRARQRDYRFYDYMKAQGQDNVARGNRQQIVAQIEGVLGRHAVEDAKAQAAQLTQAKIDGLVGSYMESIDGIPGVASLSNAGWKDLFTNLTTEEKEVAEATLRQGIMKHLEDFANGRDISTPQVMAERVRVFANAPIKDRAMEMQFNDVRKVVGMDPTHPDYEEAVAKADATYMQWRAANATNGVYLEDLIESRATDFFTVYGDLRETFPEMRREEILSRMSEAKRLRDSGMPLPRVATKDIEDTVKEISNFWIAEDGDSEIIGIGTANAYITQKAKRLTDTGMVPERALKLATEAFQNHHIVVNGGWVNIRGLVYDGNASPSLFQSALPRMLEGIQEGLEADFAGSKGLAGIEFPLSVQLRPNTTETYQVIDQTGLPIAPAGGLITLTFDDVKEFAIRREIEQFNTKPRQRGMDPNRLSGPSLDQP